MLKKYKQYRVLGLEIRLKIFLTLCCSILFLSTCKEPQNIVLDNENDPSGDSYIPSDPSNLSGVIEGEKIILGWDDNSDGESGFVIFRSHENNPFIKVGQVGENITSFEDQPDSLSVNYFRYRVQALGNADSSNAITSQQMNGQYDVSVNIVGLGIINNQEDNFVQKITYDSTFSLSATPKAGWEFQYWNDESDGLNESSVDILVDGHKSVHAKFRQVFDFEMSVTGDGEVTQEVIKSKNTFGDGSIIQLTASPAFGWYFKEWKGDVLSDANPIDVEVTQNTSIEAVFEQVESYGITYDLQGEGDITLNLVNGTQLASGYTYGSVIEIIANPSQGWSFSGWTGDINSKETSQTITLTSNYSVTATFSPISYSLEYETQGGGSINLNLISGSELESGYAYGAVVELTPTPSEGWSFKEWLGDVENQNSIQTVTMTADVSLNAVFEEIIENLQLNVDGGGSISERIIQAKSSSHRKGTVIELTASADIGWEFERWSGDINTSENPTVITLDSEMDITAVFSREFLNVTQTIDGQGSLDIVVANGNSIDGKYELGTELTITAVPADSSWYFDHWEGDVTGSDNPKTVIIDAEKDINAVFKNSVTDIDGNDYKVVRIGGQVWMAENLRVTKLNNETESGSWDASGFAIQYPKNEPGLEITYGLLYRSTTPKDIICPVGWRLPDISELEHLIRSYDHHLRSTDINQLKYPGTNNTGFSLNYPGYVDNKNYSEGSFHNRVHLLSSSLISYAFIYSSGTWGTSSDADDGSTIRCLKL